MNRHRRAVRAVFFALVGGAGCTLVNGFDDVKTFVDGTYEGGTTSSGGGDAHALPDAPGIDAGPGPKGAIVMGALSEADGALHPVLTVLDPANGHEIGKRETMIVSAVRYDGLRDLWYIFESTGADFVPGPSEGSVLHVRSFDLAKGEWTELSKLPVPTLQSYDSIAVVRERLGYVAYTPVDAGSDAAVSVEFVTVDTSNPAAMTLFPAIPLDMRPVGAMGARSGTGPGGTISLVRINTGACTGSGQGAVCSVEVIPITVPNSGNPVAAAPVQVGNAPKIAIPSYAPLFKRELNMVVTPRVQADASAVVALFNPTNVSLDTTFNSAIIDSNIKPAAVAECQNVAFLVGTNSDLNLHAVPLVGSGATPAKKGTTHSGQSVYFESTSSTVIAPFSQGAGKEISAFRLQGTPTAPTLEKRQAPDWEPPQDLRPQVLAIREPLPIVCPN